MPQSLSHLLIHLIFSTRDRYPFLRDEVQQRLYPMMAEIIRERGSHCYRVGGVADHVHVAVRLSKTESVANLVSSVKSTTSKWLKTHHENLSSFAWQAGYGAFSVSPQDLNALLDYINKQEERHKTETFQEEYRKFLKQYGIQYDEQYVWG